MTQCALCLNCSTKPRPSSQLTGACLLTGKVVDTLRPHACKDWALTHINIFESRGFKLQNGVAKG